jgi:hypothetical protein
MTDWTDLDLDGLLPGEPLTSEKVLAFYQNTIAIAERAAGAPKVLGADYALLSRTVISGSPTVIDFVYDPAEYDAIHFVFSNVRMGADLRSLVMRTSSNSGASFDDGASDYAVASVGSSSPVGVSAIVIASLGLAGSEAGFSGTVTVHGPNLGLRTTVDISGGAWAPDGTLNKISASGSRLANSVTNAVRFLSSGTGGFTNGGIITAYGVYNA